MRDNIRPGNGAKRSTLLLSLFSFSLFFTQPRPQHRTYSHYTWEKKEDDTI